MSDPQKAFSRPKCAEHGKTLYNSKKEAIGALTGQLKQQRIRVYPCLDHKGRVHMSKENIKYNLTHKRQPR